VSAVGTWVRPDLIDRMMDLYCDWRTECERVRASYEHFVSIDPSDRSAAFAAYTAALDREEAACEAYARQVRLIESCWALDWDVPRRQRQRCP
jgi:hypothetical protein